MPIRYINTDLDLVAAFDLAPLAASLEADGVSPLGAPQEGGDGLWYAVLEIECDDAIDEPEVTICVMLGAIERLDDKAKTLWTACLKREFNIGYDCGDEPWAFNNGLTNSTLARMAAVGGSLRITLYPERPEPAAGAD